MNTPQTPTIRQPLLAIGSFGLHLIAAPSGRFTFVGTVPTNIDGFSGTYNDGYLAFKQWFTNLPLEAKHKYASLLRLDVFQDFLQSGTFTVSEIPSQPTEASTQTIDSLTPNATATALSPDQILALKEAQTHFGHWWKGKLKDCWMYDRYPVELQQHQPTLQHIRNSIGSHGLNKVKL